MTEQNKLYCSIRKEWVAELPEELVRQKILKHMIQDLGFPPSLIAVEKALKHMPHLVVGNRQSIPDRRVDIISFGKGIHPQFDLYPLLVVECKSVKLTPKVVSQVVGYNHFLNASFISIVNDQKMLTGWFDPMKKEYTYIEHIPLYEELLQVVKK